MFLRSQRLSSLKSFFVLFFLTALISVGVPGQQIADASNDAESAKKAEAFLEQWNKPDMPGCAVGAVRDGKFVYKRAFGLANLDHDVPNKTSTVFNLASSSKPFTAMSIALLVQQGKLSLDDDIRKYLPELPKYDETVTIQHLIHHTSGIREYQALILFGGRDADHPLNDKDLLKMLVRQKNISFKPGSKHQYSNSNYHLLGIIVGRVSGKSLRSFAEENIFKPLGMKNTQYFDNRFEVVKNRAHGYQIAPDKSIRARSSLFDLVGGGGVLTNVDDLYLWTQNYYEPTVGDKDLISRFTAPGVLNSSEKIKYAFGLFLNEYKGLPVFKHSGNMMGYRSQIVSFPEQKFTAIALCNNMSIFPSAIVEKLADIYMEGQLKPAGPVEKTEAAVLPPTTAVPATDAARYAGIYYNRDSGKMLKLSVKDGKLIESAIFKKEVPVVAASGDRLIVADGNGIAELDPVLGGAGTITEIRIKTKGGTPDIFVPVKPPLDSLQQLSEYTGTYYSEELDADHSISLKDKNLVVRISDSLQPTLTPEYADSFSTANGQIFFSFVRDDKGKITGFVFNSGVDSRDVKAVAFQRR